MDLLWQHLGEHAASLIEDGMLLGLGTGRTASHFIQALAARVQEGLQVTAVATSLRSFALAQKLGISVLDMDDTPAIDLVVDGADEVTLQKQLVKGGGGALLREKILAGCSKKVLILIDETKCVQELGAFGLPLEIVPFGYAATLQKISSLGYRVQLRHTPEGLPLENDNGHYAADILFQAPIKEPIDLHLQLLEIPGVIETGLFLNLSPLILCVYQDGTLKSW